MLAYRRDPTGPNLLHMGTRSLPGWSAACAPQRGGIAPTKFELNVTNSVVSTCERDIELLPRNHWGGLSHLPEMVAAFVQPNDPDVDRLLKTAAQLLRDSNRNPALNGYEAGPKHAWEILSAIWE